jgi:hypothetical protein
MKVNGQHYASAALPHKERAPGTRWVGSWIGPTVTWILWRRLPQDTKRGDPGPDFTGSGGCRGPLLDPGVVHVTVTQHTELLRRSTRRHAPVRSSVIRVAICSNDSMLCRYLWTPGRYACRSDRDCRNMVRVS